MAADIVEGAQLAVVAANHNQRFLVHVDGKKLAGFLHLIEASHDLPIGRKYTVAFELFDALVEIPRRGNEYGPCSKAGRLDHTDSNAANIVLKAWPESSKQEKKCGLILVKITTHARKSGDENPAQGSARKVLTLGTRFSCSCVVGFGEAICR